MTMTNSRCFRIDRTLNRFVTSTKCNPTKSLVSGLSSQGAETTRLDGSHHRVRAVLNHSNLEGSRFKSGTSPEERGADASQNSVLERTVHPSRTKRKGYFPFPCGEVLDAISAYPKVSGPSRHGAITSPSPPHVPSRSSISRTK